MTVIRMRREKREAFGKTRHNDPARCKSDTFSCRDFQTIASPAGGTIARPMTAKPQETAESVQSTLLTIVGLIPELQRDRTKSPCRSSCRTTSILAVRWSAPPPFFAKFCMRQRSGQVGNRLLERRSVGRKSLHSAVTSSARRFGASPIYSLAHFKDLKPGLRAKPGSLGTAQAIIGRLQKLF